MGTVGENPSDLAERLPPGSYVVCEPIQRSGLIYAHVRHRTAGLPFEGGITPAADILSLHRTTFDGRAWRNGRLIHDGSIAAHSISLVKAGDESVVALTGDLDIVQVFLPHGAVGALAAEINGRPASLSVEGWTNDPVVESLVERTLAALKSSVGESRLETDILALKLAEHMVRYHGGGGGTVFRRTYFGGLSPLVLRRVLDFIDANLQHDIQLTDLAREVQLTPYHFLRSFHAETGLTPHQWVMRRRIGRAKSLLADTNLPIAEIALAIGYASQSAMTAIFSRLVGITPREWRTKRH